MGCVAAEVRDPRRNILRALLLGAAVVTVVYLGINAACWKLLGLRGDGDVRSAAVDAALVRVGPVAEHGR